MKHFLLYVRRNYKVKAKKTDVSHKLKVARGQLDGILKMVDENRYCVDILVQISAIRSAIGYASAIKKRKSRNYAGTYTELCCRSITDRQAKS